MGNTKVRFKSLLLIIFPFCNVLALGYIDYVTGTTISFSFFYFLSIAFFAWFLPKLWVIVPLILIFIERFYADVISPHNHLYSISPYWNIFWEMVFSILIIFFFFRLKSKLETITKQKKRLDEDIKLIQEQTKQLVEAGVELERAKRLAGIGVLAATVAHELRNPLTRIALAAHNIRNKAKNPDLEKHLISVDKSLAESEQIISNLLYYSRLKPPHYERVDILDILEECTEGLQKRARKKIAVIKNLDPISGLLIEADPLQMKEVFNNILNNACDVVPTDKGQIKLIAENEDKFIKVVIEDNGTGIDHDVLDKIFEPFFTTKAKGTGLGLSVCQQIVKAHGGEIEIKNAQGQGAAFIVCLPKVRAISEPKMEKSTGSSQSA
jgi:signal transduction histidine kinase